MIRSWRRAGSPRVWMLAFLPVTAGLAVLAPERQVPLFVCACAAMDPLAPWIGRATEQLAERVGEGPGGLLNATLGNAPDLILGVPPPRPRLDPPPPSSLSTPTPPPLHPHA